MENQPTKSSPDEKDIDLGVLFSLLSSIFKKMLHALRQLLDMLLSVIVWLLLLIRKKIWWLLGAMVLGVLPGVYNYFSLGREFYSSMIVRSNFESVHNLYNKVDYFNGLIKSGENKKIAGLFHISEEYAGRLTRFEIAPVDDQLQAAALYKAYFYNPDDFNRVERDGKAMLVRDSAWSNLIKFKDFKDKLKPYDFPLQEVRVYSRSSAGFSNIEAGLVAAVSENAALRQRQQIADSTSREQSKIIHSSVANADSLMHAFSKSIATGTKSENGVLTVQGGSSRSPEVEIFDQAVRLKNELGKMGKDEADNHDILQVYADFSDPGVPISPFRESFMDYSLWCLLIVFILLLVLEAYNAIDVREKQKRNA